MMQPRLSARATSLISRATTTSSRLIVSFTALVRGVSGMWFPMHVLLVAWRPEEGPRRAPGDIARKRPSPLLPDAAMESLHQAHVQDLQVIIALSPKVVPGVIPAGAIAVPLQSVGVMQCHTGLA